jgi:hypothetical protein
LGQELRIRNDGALSHGDEDLAAWPELPGITPEKREIPADVRMAVKRSKKKTMPKALSKAYEQAMLAEGAPVTLDLLGFGSTIGDVIRGLPRKAAKRRAKKKTRAGVKTPRAKKAKKKSARRTSRRKR